MSVLIKITKLIKFTHREMSDALLFYTFLQRLMNPCTILPKSPSPSTRDDLYSLTHSELFIFCLPLLKVIL